MHKYGRQHATQKEEFKYFFPLFSTRRYSEKEKRAFIIGGGILGLITARRLVDEYEVTLVNKTPLDKTNFAGQIDLFIDFILNKEKCKKRSR